MLVSEATSNSIRNDLNTSSLFIAYDDEVAALPFNCIRVCFRAGATKDSQEWAWNVPAFLEEGRLPPRSKEIMVLYPRKHSLSKLLNKRFTKCRGGSGFEEGRLPSKGDYMTIARYHTFTKLYKKCFTK